MRADIALMVDHTLLKPEATKADVVALIQEAKELGAYSVCVSPAMLPLPESELGELRVATVIGFPSGAVASEIKAAEASRAVANGADEIDMVINLGLVKAGDWPGVEADITLVREAAPYAVLKVIIESAVLDDDEITRVCECAQAAGADFVKTSTGFHPAGGASVHAVEIMKQAVGDDLQIKASGGIRDGKFAQELIAAGATRLGLSGTRTVLDSLD